MNRPIVYFDMDDVLADLTEGLHQHSGHLREEMTASDFFDTYLPAYARDRGFETQIPLINSKKLVDNVLELVYAEKLNVAILTSVGHFYEPVSDIVHQKKRWLEKHFPELVHVPFVTVTAGKMKAQMAHSKAFLIDDHKTNVYEFIKWGGSGIVYTPDLCDSVISKIKKDILC